MAESPEFHKLLTRYFSAVNISSAEISPETLEITFPNGLSGSIAKDMEQVLAVNDIASLRFSNEQAFQVGLVVGAALQRDGIVPERFESAIEAIGPNT